jgi:hypothetical protein
MSIASKQLQFILHNILEHEPARNGKYSAQNVIQMLCERGKYLSRMFFFRADLQFLLGVGKLFSLMSVLSLGTFPHLNFTILSEKNVKT